MEKPSVFQPLPHDTTGLPLAEAMLLLLLLLDRISIEIIPKSYCQTNLWGLGRSGVSSTTLAAEAQAERKQHVATAAAAMHAPSFVFV